MRFQVFATLANTNATALRPAENDPSFITDVIADAAEASYVSILDGSTEVARVPAPGTASLRTALIVHGALTVKAGDAGVSVTLLGEVAKDVQR